MDIIKEYAEVKLVRHLNAMKQSPTTWRCIQLDFSTLEDKTKQVLGEDIFAKIIDDLFEFVEGRIYICEEDTVFLLFQNNVASIYDKLKLHLPTFLAITWRDEFATIYDLGNSWASLATICEQRLEAIREREQKIKAKQESIREETERNNILNMSIDDDLLNTIDARRSKRENTEILIVEDDAFSRKLVRNSLEKDYNVSTAEDGKSTFENYANKAPNIIFLDIELPDITGHEILRKIISIDPKAFVIMLSGNGDKENVMKAMKNGAKGFVAKPFTKAKLIDYINKCPTTHAS